MNVTNYTSILNKPDAINDIQSVSLEKIVHEFPFFQSARALYLKGLYNQNSFKYNSALKVTASHTADRSVLFDLITSEFFSGIQIELYEKKLSEILNISVLESELVGTENSKLISKINSPEESIRTSIKNANPVLKENDLASVLEEVQAVKPDETEINQAIETEKLHSGKPLHFLSNENHSFQEWLQLSKIQPIIRENTDADSVLLYSEKQKKNSLIDKFIQASPKISPVKQDAQIPSVLLESSQTDNSYLMTETLARIYMEQKKYSKAIQAYEILILKYPEKSSFFANRILEIKNLQ